MYHYNGSALCYTVLCSSVQYLEEHVGGEPTGGPAQVCGGKARNGGVLPHGDEDGGDVVPEEDDRDAESDGDEGGALGQAAHKAVVAGAIGLGGEGVQGPQYAPDRGDACGVRAMPAAFG